MNPLRHLRPVTDRTGGDRGAEGGGGDELAEALRGAARGDEAAFGRYYDLAAPLVHGIVLRVVRDPAMAEEVTQEVFIELWRLAPRYDRARGSVRSWTATVAHRRAVDRVRSEEARRRREEAESGKRAAEFDHVAEDVADRLERSRVERALEALSESQRDAVTLAYYGGNTYREVAALLQVPEGTVKTRIRDGLIKLRDQFGVTS